MEVTRDENIGTLVVQYAEAIICDDADEEDFVYTGATGDRHPHPDSIECKGPTLTMIFTLFDDDDNDAVDAAKGNLLYERTSTTGRITDLTGNLARNPDTKKIVPEIDSAEKIGPDNEMIEVIYTEPVRCQSGSTIANQFSYELLDTEVAKATGIECIGTNTVTLTFEVELHGDGVLKYEQGTSAERLKDVDNNDAKSSDSFTFS